MCSLFIYENSFLLGVKKFSCIACNKSFARLAALQKHTKTHLNVSFRETVSRPRKNKKPSTIIQKPSTPTAIKIEEDNSSALATSSSVVLEKPFS